MRRHLEFVVRGICAAALVICVGGFSNPTFADTEIRAFDCEGDNDPDFMFTFSDMSLVMLTMDDDSPNGNGSEGIEFAVTETATGPTFAGAGLGLFELNVDPRFVVGEMTVELLDLLVFTFDAETLGTPINSVRFEASLPAGDFDNRVEITPPNGPWETYSIAFADLDLASKQAMVASMNTNLVTGMNFAFSFTQDEDGSFLAGDTVRLDNVSLVACEPMTTVDVAVASFEVTRGTFNSGGLTELAASDNADLGIRRGSTDILSRCYIEVTATSPTLSPSQIDLTVEASVFARTAVAESIDMFDYVAGEFVELDTRPAMGFSDSVVVVVGTGDLSRFVNPADGEILAQVRFDSARARQAFASNIDNIFWTISQ